MTQKVEGLERTTASWISEKFFLGLPLSQYLKGLMTPFNAVAAFLVLLGLPFLFLRYAFGLAAVTHASNDQPFGMFLSYGVIAGVPMASTGFLMATAVYLFGLRQYKQLLRPAILTGLIGYFFAVLFLLIDLGQPWRLPYPMIKSFGTGSVLFLVGWHVALYLSVQLLEFSPTIFEWLQARRLRAWAVRITIGATIFGVILSTLHQSALGALFLLAPHNLHPLWYSPYLPVLFFVSAIFCGLSVVILEAALIYHFLPDRVAASHRRLIDRLTLGLGKAAALTMMTYFCLKIISVAHDNEWAYLATGYGQLFLLETIGFVLVPCMLFASGVRHRNASVVRLAAVLAVVGVIMNRLIVAIFGLGWGLPHREFAHPRELLILVSMITIEILLYRWVVNRLPVHRDLPTGPDAH